MQDTFEINGRSVGRQQPCFVIAEAGVAHFGSLEKAKKLVDLAVEAKADAVKFQIFDVDRMISSAAQDWKDRMKSRCLGFVEFEEVKSYCETRRITFLATPHDEAGLSMLGKLSVPAYKVGSGELGNPDFIGKILDIGLPVIISTGMYSTGDLDAVVELCRQSGNERIALMHCVTQYPTPPEEANLSRLSRLREKFEGVIGYSDHTIGTHIPLAAVGLGAKVIEKHISLDFDVPDAQDWKVSCGPETFCEFVQQIREIEKSMDHTHEILAEAESENRLWACKSLVLTRGHLAGEILQESSVTAKRPGTGIMPSKKFEVLGRKLNKEKEFDSVLHWDDVI